MISWILIFKSKQLINFQAPRIKIRTLGEYIKIFKVLRVCKVRFVPITSLLFQKTDWHLQHTIHNILITEEIEAYQSSRVGGIYSHEEEIADDISSSPLQKPATEP